MNANQNETAVLRRVEAKHLLERCLFGAKNEELDAFSRLTKEEALDVLLQDGSTPSPPISIDERDTDAVLGESWVGLTYNSKFRNYRLKSLRSWWIGLTVNQGTSLTEKMTLFFHNHFVTETVVVKRSKYLFNHYSLLREHAMGNFKELVKAITVDPAMMVYLNNDTNNVASPNENYARELLELFTIGKGPQIAPGNYTNYTEHDIQEAARVLTGWKVNADTSSSWFNASKHDTKTKTFSELFGNQSIDNQGEKEYRALVDMLFAKKETARYLVRKLYRFFVYSKIDAGIESSVIEPLATLFYESNYELKPLLRALLSGDHFYNEAYLGCYIKNPAEFALGAFRKLNMTFSTDELTNYEMWNTLYWKVNGLEMKLGDPPDVAGWTAWYLSPQFNQLWINSVTIPNRAAFVNQVCSYGFTKKDYKYAVDVIAMVENVSKPTDPNILIKEWGYLFLPIELAQNRIDDLKEVLIPGLPDFEWGVEWNKFKSNPANTNQKKAVESVLKKLLVAMVNLPDYHLM